MNYLALELLESDDEDTEEKLAPPAAVPIANRPGSGAVTVKAEPTCTGKRSASASEDNSENASPPKRIKETTDTLVEASPLDRNASKTIDEEATPVETEAATPAQRVTVSPPASQDSILSNNEGASESAIVAKSVSRSSSSIFDEENTDKDASTGMVEVRLFLDRCQLALYEAKFEANGYDSLQWLYDIASDTAVMEKLATDVGFKPGHAIRFQHVLTKEATEAKQLSIQVSSVAGV